MNKKTKITFVEQQQDIFHYPYPSLSLAYLIGVCRDNKISYSLVHGFSRFGKDLFLDEVKEILELTEKYNKKEKAILSLKKCIEKSGAEKFVNYMKNVYKSIKEKDTSYFLNPNKVITTKKIVDGIFALYEYYALKGHDISFVRKLSNGILQTYPSIILFPLWFGTRKTNFLLIKTINRIKRKRNDIPIIVLFGGPYHAHSEKEVEKILGYADIDGLIVYGEHLDRDIKTIINQLAKYGASSLQAKQKISSLIYKEQGKIVKNPDINIKTMDELPDPDFSKFHLYSYFTPFPILPLQSSKGCPWRKCLFCTYHDDSNPIFYSKENFARLVKKYMEKYNINKFFLHDLTLSSARAQEISNCLVKENLNNAFFLTPARLEKGYTKELFDKMYNAGFRAIFWGLESGCQKTINSMRKGIDLNEVRRILKESYEAGLSNGCFLMFGFPNETREQALETIRFLVENKRYIDSYVLSDYVHHEHSPLWNANKDYALNFEVIEILKVIRNMEPRNTRFTNDFSDKIRIINVINIFFQTIYGKNCKKFLNRGYDDKR